MPNVDELAGARSQKEEVAYLTAFFVHLHPHDTDCGLSDLSIHLLYMPFECAHRNKLINHVYKLMNFIVTKSKKMNII